MPGKWGGARRARPPLDPPMKNSGSRSILQKGDNEHNMHSMLDEFPGSVCAFEKSFADLPGVFGLERNSKGFGPWGNHQSTIKPSSSTTIFPFKLTEPWIT